MHTNTILGASSGIWDKAVRVLIKYHDHCIILSKLKNNYRVCEQKACVCCVDGGMVEVDSVYSAILKSYCGCYGWVDWHAVCFSTVQPDVHTLLHWVVVVCLPIATALLPMI